MRPNTTHTFDYGRDFSLLASCGADRVYSGRRDLRSYGRVSPLVARGQIGVQSAHAMALPPKQIMIRIVVYGGLISYFGWQAYDAFSERSAAEAAASEAAPADPFKPNSSIRLKDGTQMPVLELTPEEFEQRTGRKPPSTALTADELERELNAAKAAQDDEAPKPPDLPPEAPPTEAEEPQEAPEPKVNPRLAPLQGEIR